MKFDVDTSDLKELEKRTFAIRLYQLAHYLKALPDGRYNHQTWAADRECGTVGCALGHATMSGWFADTGLKLLKSHWTEGNHQIRLVRRSKPCPATAATRVFGPGSFEYIFSLTRYDDVPTRSQVIRRIRSFARQVFGYEEVK